MLTRTSVQMIFDGLLSRTRLRRRLAERSELEVGFPSEVRDSTSATSGASVLNRNDVVSHYPQFNSHSSPSSSGAREGKRTSTTVHGSVSLVTMADFRTGTQITEDLPGSERDANSELEGEICKKPLAGAGPLGGDMSV